MCDDPLHARNTGDAPQRRQVIGGLDDECRVNGLRSMADHPKALGAVDIGPRLDVKVRRQVSLVQEDLYLRRWISTAHDATQYRPDVLYDVDFRSGNVAASGSVSIVYHNDTFD